MIKIIGLKELQLEAVLKHNPMLDDYHRGIRKVSDIKTFAEVVNDDESFVYGDFSKQDALNALKTGTITVYSSKAINPGDFVSTSRRMAQDYAGFSGKVNQREVKLTDIAWLDGDEGVFTGPLSRLSDTSSDFLSAGLVSNLKGIVSKYYPEGDLLVLSVAYGKGLLEFTPNNQNYPPLWINTVGDSIHSLGALGDTKESTAFVNAFNEAKKRATAKKQAPAKPAKPVLQVQAPAKPVAPAQAPTQSTPKNYRRIDGSKRKLYFVEGQFYPPYSSVIVAIGDSPQNSEVYTEDGQKLYLGVKRYKLLKQGTRAGLQVTPINPNNGGSKKALEYFKIELV